jgi:C1A family cysteine protease
MTSVKFQRQCGSCYAFTAISAIESAYILRGKFLNLAEQELVDCSNPYGNFGCTGGWTTNAYKYIKDFGLVSEREYPYNASANKCTVENGNNKVWIKNFVELKNDCSLVAQALKNQPLSIAINADGWQYYAKGIYTDCRAGASNHGVVLAGMDSTSWLIKNSWGYSWGEDGYIRVSRTAPNKACNVCEWASYPVV